MTVTIGRRELLAALGGAAGIRQRRRPHHPTGRTCLRYTRRERVIALAARYAVPTMYVQRDRRLCRSYPQG
jgi:hypothetical protein